MASKKPTNGTDIHIYTYMPRVLRYGGIFGALVLLIGLFLFYTLTGEAKIESPLLSVTMTRLFHLDPSAWLNAGVIIFLSTPTLGLIAAAIGSVCDADWRLFSLCLLLLALLLVTVFVTRSLL